MTPAKSPDVQELKSEDCDTDHVEDISEKKDGGLCKVIIREGTGDQHPFKGSEVKVHYVGRLADGTKFDSSRDRLQPFEFLIGSGSVIKGWELGVKTMRKGEICKLICKPEYGYGAKGCVPRIPPNSTLEFEVELLDWSELNVCGNGDVTKIVIVEGQEWQNPARQDIIKAHITGKSGKVVFLDEDMSFELCEASEHGLCKGLEKGIGRMVRGEKSRFKIQPGQLSYTTEQRTRLNIPQNTEMLFYVELKDFVRSTPVWDLDSAGRLNYAGSMKERGTAFFKQGKFGLALEKYEFLVQALDGIFKEEDKEAGAPLKLAGHLNSAACHLKMMSYGSCIDESTKALEIDPVNIKALFRRGNARLKIGDIDLAKLDLSQAVKLDPKNKPARDLLREAAELVKRQKKKEKNIYANMFQKFAEEDKRREVKQEEESLRQGDTVFQEATENAPVDSQMEDAENDQSIEQKEGTGEDMQVNSSERNEQPMDAEETTQQDDVVG